MDADADDADGDGDADVGLSSDRKSKWNSYYAVKKCMLCMFSKQIRLADTSHPNTLSSLSLPLIFFRTLRLILHMIL